MLTASTPQISEYQYFPPLARQNRPDLFANQNQPKMPNDKQRIPRIEKSDFLVAILDFASYSRSLLSLSTGGVKGKVMLSAEEDGAL
jgi:hypothetical protein